MPEKYNPKTQCTSVKLVTSHFYLVCVLENNFELVNLTKVKKRLNLTSISHLHIYGISLRILFCLCFLLISCTLVQWCNTYILLTKHTRDLVFLGKTRNLIWASICNLSFLLNFCYRQTCTHSI